MVRLSRIVIGVCLGGVFACRLMIDQSMVDVRAQAEKALLVFRGRVLTVGPDPVEKGKLTTSRIFDQLASDLEFPSFALPTYLEG